MFLAEHLADFYPDLLDPRFVSRFAIYHQRYSTNTFPDLAAGAAVPHAGAQRRDQHRLRATSTG